jgi:ribonuclease HI
MAKAPLVECWFDGACLPVNPGGHGSWGALVTIDNRLAYRQGGYIGHGPELSNNVAEYSGFIAVARWLLDANLPQGSSIIIHGDSILVVNQLRGSWKARAGLYLPYYRSAKLLLEELKNRPGVTVRLEWVPREFNSLCDELSEEVLVARGVFKTEQP